MPQQKSGAQVRKPTSGATAARKAAAGRPPAKKKPGKSIVNQRQTPWGLIVVAVVLVVFAGAIIGVVVSRSGGSSSSSDTYNHVSVGGQSVSKSDPYRQPELAAAKKIPGIQWHIEASHTHVLGTIKYDRTPPIGGDHSAYWADCTGTVYPQPIANENAVHMLEHGAVWITYNAKTLPADQLAVLKKMVQGHNYSALSPYPDLKTPLSLQAWNYQLFVQKATDPRVKQFFDLFSGNQQNAPEKQTTCSQPTFKQHPSTFGHPLEAPAA